MAVLRDEDGAVCLADAPDICGEIVAALRERNDILGRTATADGRVKNLRHFFLSCLFVENADIVQYSVSRRKGAELQTADLDDNGN